LKKVLGIYKVPVPSIYNICIILTDFEKIPDITTIHKYAPSKALSNFLLPQSCRLCLFHLKCIAYRLHRLETRHI